MARIWKCANGCGIFNVSRQSPERQRFYRQSMTFISICRNATDAWPLYLWVCAGASPTSLPHVRATSPPYPDLSATLWRLYRDLMATFLARSFSIPGGVLLVPTLGRLAGEGPFLSQNQGKANRIPCFRRIAPNRFSTSQFYLKNISISLQHSWSLAPPPRLSQTMAARMPPWHRWKNQSLLSEFQ